MLFKVHFFLIILISHCPFSYGAKKDADLTDQEKFKIYCQARERYKMKPVTFQKWKQDQETPNTIYDYQMNVDDLVNGRGAYRYGGKIK